MHLSNILLTFAAAVAGTSAGLPQQQGNSQVLLFAGSYTRDEGWVNGTGAGVTTIKFNPVDGSLKIWASTAIGNNPRYVVGTKKPFETGERVIYVINAVTEDSVKYPGTQTGWVSAHTLKKDGKLEHLNTLETRGGSPTHISLSPNEDFLIVSNYQGSITMFPLNSDGSLGADSYHQEYKKGSGVAPPQTNGILHSTTWVPESNHVIAANLGSDELYLFELDAKDQDLKLLETVNRPPGSGPRHMAIRPDKKFAYVVDEIGNTVGVYAIDKTTGMLSTTALQNITTLPAGYKDATTSADIHISSDNKYLYTSNRGHNSIAMYKIDGIAGTLTPLGFESTRGKIPHGFTVYGKWLIVANQDSNNMHVFEISANGRLKYSGHSLDIGTVVCLYATEYNI
ncbi:pgl [Plasmopara halstedii]|uniref:Pgl n=1 Tax=Plasmopara halstedii TaxID=4781 RepID=A0A0P1AWT2_PLAHL|nr:pgl [Plasmopara halstedii]CEG45631.1 pgl [Plasmopara halstedii]|eukprot:XP_024582000.1 pgl [Plasmopara halstedii]